MAMADIKRGLEAAGGDARAYFASKPPETEALLHFRYVLGRNLTKAGTFAGVEEGLKSFLEVDHLCASTTEIGNEARAFIPGLLLRLGREKECLAFLKKVCGSDLDDIYRRNDRRSAPRPPANAGALSLAHAAMLCVFKLRILQDLYDLDEADLAIGERLPAEIFDEICSYLIGEATKTDAAIMSAIGKDRDLTPEIETVEQDLRDLRAYIENIDPDYFDAIDQPDKYKKMQPAYEPELPITEALAQTYDAWAETPGAFVMFLEVTTRPEDMAEDEHVD
jgi:hypothetical protein